MLATVFLGLSPVARQKRGGENTMRPVRLKWIALPLCTIVFDRNFDSPIALFYLVSLHWITRSGAEGP
jgi:hypothetical protein